MDLLSPRTPWRRPLACVYGGGGVFGIAYGLGVAHGVQEAGVPVHEAPALGTSAGSWVASCVALGTDPLALLDHPPVRVPNLRPGWLLAQAREVLGDARHRDVTASAVDLMGLRRRLLRGDAHRLADLVAASSAVPGLFAPHLVGGHPLVDGGVRSMASADQAPVADHLLLVAPLAGPVLSGAGLVLQRQAVDEMHRWERRTGGRAHLLRPCRRIAALATDPRHLFDVRRAADVYWLAFAQAQELVRSRPGLAPLLRPAAA